MMSGAAASEVLPRGDGDQSLRAPYGWKRTAGETGPTLRRLLRVLRNVRLGFRGGRFPPGRRALGRRGTTRQRRRGCRRRRLRGLRRRRPGQPFDCRAYWITRTAVASRVQNRLRRTRPLDAALWVGQYDRVIPRSLHNEGQLECGCRRTRAARRNRKQARGSPEIEFALRNRSRTRQRETDARPLHANILDVRDALDDFQIDGERLVGRLPGAELAAARERSALDALEQLLDIEPGDGALAAGEARGAVESLGQVVDAAARAIDREAEIAFALEPANAEHVTKALVEIDIGELQLGPEISAGRRFRQPERPPDHAAEGLRLADRHREIAAAQIGRHRRAPELGIRDIDAGG